MRSNKKDKESLRKNISVSEMSIRNYTENLFNNPAFISDVKKIREDHAIPKNGYTRKQMWGKGTWNKKLKTDLYFFSEDIEKLQNKYDLPLIWLREIKEWVLTNVFSFGEMKGSTMISVYDLKYEIKLLESDEKSDKSMGLTSLRTLSRDHPIIIAIHPSISKTALLDFISRNFESRIKPLKEKYNPKGSLIGKVRSKNIDTQKMNKRIMNLCDLGIKRKEITEMINKEFGVSKNYTDINTIIREQRKLQL